MRKRYFVIRMLNSSRIREIEVFRYGSKSSQGQGCRIRAALTISIGAVSSSFRRSGNALRGLNFIDNSKALAFL